MTVGFMVVACPKCGSRRIRCEGTRMNGRKRYYRCRGCQNRFTAWRVEPSSPAKSDEDRPHVRTPER